jgi:acyl carrier protein
MKQATNLVGPHHSELLAFITESVRTVSAKARGLTITPDSLLFEELALDSLDLVAVVLQIQDHYHVEIEPDEIPAMRSVNDLAASLCKHVRAAAATAA